MRAPAVVKQARNFLALCALAECTLFMYTSRYMSFLPVAAGLGLK